MAEKDEDNWEDFHKLFCRNMWGEPCRFSLDLVQKDLQRKITNWIRMGGGTIEDKRKNDTTDSRIMLVDGESVMYKNRSEIDVFSVQYIEDCVANKKLLPNLKDYRVNSRSIFEDYEPTKVLMGKLKWSDINRKFSAELKSPRKLIFEEDEISDIDDEVVLKAPVAKIGSSTNSSSTGMRKVTVKKIKASAAIKAAVLSTRAQQESNKKVSAWLSKQENPPKNTTFNRSLNSTLGSRNPYTKKEEESIIKEVVKHHAYNKIGGNTFWKHCEERGEACKGARTWQSMKERFRKKILPVIHITHRQILTDEELANFEKCIKGEPVSEPTSTDHDLTLSTEYDNLENLPSVKQSTPKQNKSKKLQKQPEQDDNVSTESSDLFAEIELTTGPIRKSPRLAKTDSPKKDSPKRKRKLYSGKNNLTSPLVSETPSTQRKTFKKAKEDYLQVEDGAVASTSKAVFKEPKAHRTASQVIVDSDSDSDNISTVSSKGNPYSRSEELKILQWIAKQRRFTETSGIAMWRALEMSGEVKGRSHQSMKERFRKHILPNIDVYDIEEEDKQTFKMHRNTKYSKRQSVKPKKKK